MSLQCPRIGLAVMLVLLAACGGEAPGCPFSGEPVRAPSAGCLAVEEGRLLLVQSWSGDVGPPGGTSEPGESAQCTAHRETWEETGLDLIPVELTTVFDTGFHLYHCRAGDAPPGPGSRRWTTEVRRVLWLPLEELSRQAWRYPGQAEILQRLISDMERSQP